MAISSASVLKDGTVSTTGGTATSLASLGNTLGQHNCYFDDGSEFLAQSNIDFTVKAPKVSATAPNGYTQARNTVLIKVPLALDNGSVTVNTVRIDFASDIEMTDAERLTMRVYAAQILSDSDFTEFWDNQSLS